MSGAFEQCPQSMQDNCPRKGTKNKCRVVEHHLFYPKPAYAEIGRLALEFRQLPTNRVRMCEEEEKALHRQNPEGPPVPSPKVMEHCVSIERQRRSLSISDSIDNFLNRLP